MKPKAKGKKEIDFVPLHTAFLIGAITAREYKKAVKKVKESRKLIKQGKVIDIAKLMTDEGKI